MKRLSNKTVLITGASSGIGAACAECYAQSGANVVITARRLERLQSLATRLQQDYQVKVLPLELDVTNAEQVKSLVEGLSDEWQSIDILVNNAGISTSVEKLQDTAIEQWDQMIDVNVKGLLYVTKAILPGMLKRNQGHIINIGSLACHYIYARANVYAATKQAVQSITQTLRIDLLGTPIRVTQVDPGPTRTELPEVRWEDKAKADAFYEKMQPLDPMDIAEVVVFCSTRKAYINIDDVIVNTIDMAASYQARQMVEEGNSIFD